MHGFTDNYIKVKTTYNPDLINQLKQVQLKELDSDGSMLIIESKEISSLQ